MKHRIILHLSLAIVATTLIILNSVFVPILWLAIVSSILLGCLNGYHIGLFIAEVIIYRNNRKLFTIALQRFLHYAQWQASHPDMNIEDYKKYQMKIER